MACCQVQPQKLGSTAAVAFSLFTKSPQVFLFTIFESACVDFVCLARPQAVCVHE